MGCIKKVIHFVENPFHIIPKGIENIIQSVAPIALSAIGQPELGAALAGANGYANAAPGQGLKSGLLQGGLAYAGSKLGSTLGSAFGGGGGEALNDGVIKGSTGSLLGDLSAEGSGLASTGVLSGGIGGATSSYGAIGDAVGSAYDSVKDAVSPLTNGISDAYHGITGGISDAANSVADFAKPATDLVSDTYNGISSGISDAGNAIGQVAKPVTDLASGAAKSLGIGSTLSNTGGQVASNSGSLLSGLSKYSPLLSAGLGAYTNYSAKNDLLDAEKKNQALLQPFLNQTFTPGDLTQDPGFQFQLAQGNQALDRKQAASGNYFSGGALKEAQNYGQGLASTTFNDAFNRYLANQGQQLQAAGALTGVNNDIGNTKAGSITNLGNLFAGTGGSLLGGQSFGNQGQLLGQAGGGLDLASILKLAQQNKNPSQYGV